MDALPSATRHQFFSFGRISAIASNTLLELVRLKVFYFMLIFALVIIGLSFFLSTLTFQEQFQVLKDMSLGAMTIFTWLLAVLSTAMLLPKDIEDRTLYTILAKPVPRFEYLLGKILGVLLLLFIAISLMSALFVVILYLKEQSAIAEVSRTTSPAALQEQIDSIRAHAFTWNLVPGIVFIYLEAGLSAALTLLISTFASSSIFTIMVSVVVYIIGHVQPIARDYALASHGVSAATKVWLALVSLLIPDLTAFSLVDDIAAGTAISLVLFLKVATLGGIYILVYFFVSYFVFSTKEL
jgi:hypothetical protein